MKNLNKEKVAIALMLGISLLAIIILWFTTPIPQDQNYHHFHDVKEIGGIANFWNVISNLPFLFVGLWGLLWIFQATPHHFIEGMKYSYITFFIGILCVALGSAYYHLSPNNSTLLWDRLPMTVAFMALFSLIVAEFVSVKVGRLLIVPLLILGVFSVLYWHFSELAGTGDLRLYILVQFLPILLIPLILLFFKSYFTHGHAYWFLLLAYLVAKLLEYFDAETYQLTLLLSGHSLKHMVAAFGLYLLVRSYKKRSIY